jgi:hypothetical protein
MVYDPDVDYPSQLEALQRTGHRRGRWGWRRRLCLSGAATLGWWAFALHAQNGAVAEGLLTVAFILAAWAFMPRRRERS